MPAIGISRRTGNNLLGSLECLARELFSYEGPQPTSRLRGNIFDFDEHGGIFSILLSVGGSMKPTLTVTADFTDNFNAIIKKFKRDAVLIGIPQEETIRDAGKDGITPLINNATLLAINEFGSPANNIPARPVMAIGIKSAQGEITNQFKKAAIDALSNGFSALTKYYERVGIIASNSVKKAINAQEGFPGPAESTLESRKAKGFPGTKSLVVTGQMRNAITYVVKPGGL